MESIEAIEPMEAVEAVDLDNGLAMLPRRVEPRAGSGSDPSDLEAIRSLLAASGDAESPLELRRWLDHAEAWYIARTLRALRGNRSAAARALGIGRRTLYAKMQKLGIEASWGPGTHPWP
jgi:DNA-binding NtrC family response regulator